MHAFIVRPFGIRDEINFDKVEKDLILPAMAELGIKGGPATNIIQQGNIRSDMFLKLLTVDLVIADLSLDNANVFYELGLRHAARARRTFLLRCRSDKATPFDLLTDRYFLYDKDEPAKSRNALVRALDATLHAEIADSPFFQLLTGLEGLDRLPFITVPVPFREEVARAASIDGIGDLQLLAEEIRDCEWANEGLRYVGRAMCGIRAFKPAANVWEAVLQYDAGDVEANIELAVVHQSLNDTLRADQALDRASASIKPKQEDCAEIASLMGNNAKANWEKDWNGSANPADRALRSPYLAQAFERYKEGFEHDLNHFYSGAQALLMLSITLELARKLPQVWAERFNTEQEAKRELESIEEELQTLTNAVRVSIDAESKRPNRDKESLRWLGVSRAIWTLVTARAPAKAAWEYRDAIADVSYYAADVLERDLNLLERLGIHPENAQRAREIVKAKSCDTVARVLLFAGHCVDEPGRHQARFAPQMEPWVRSRIREEISKEIELSGRTHSPRRVIGIAGAAGGGDILFHEVCAEKDVDVETQLCLSLPKDEYAADWVTAAGPEWIERFNLLYERQKRKSPMAVRIHAFKRVPDWLRESSEYNVVRRYTQWLLLNALAVESSHVTLIALWDGRANPADGSVADMIDHARRRGIKTVIIDINAFAGDLNAITGSDDGALKASRAKG